ncbi:MAG: hypothetical protein GY774_16470 [Planctomycetes bacterium]|nr:hypothetical protein [Planctomycetota bacterium]
MNKSISIITLSIVLLLSTSVLTYADVWYEGGNLHKATIKEWNDASYRNRLATAADWFNEITKTSNPDLKKELDSYTLSQWLSAIKEFSEQLEICVTELATNKQMLKAWGEKEVMYSHVATLASLCYTSIFLTSDPQSKNTTNRTQKKSDYEDMKSYKDWQPYKDYLRLPKSYHSPEMEKSYKDSYEAEEIVKNLPCSKGGTLDQYFSKNRHPQLEDLGWNEFTGENGVDVVREFLGQTKILEYKWHVDKTGKAKAINAEAIGITASVIIQTINSPPAPKQPEQPGQEYLSYEVLSNEDVSIAGCTRVIVRILVPSGAENNIHAIKKLITRILNDKGHFCEYSVYALIKGKEDVPIIYGKYEQEGDFIVFHSNESTFYGMYPRE